MDASLLIIEKFQKYFNIKPTEIYQEKGIIRVKFSINNIAFKTIYNTKESSIDGLLFDEVYDYNSEIAVKNFSISLDDEHKTTINSFVLDPLGYIKSINPNAYQAYLKYK
ncbi:MAG: hypothetical protein GXP45_06290 [bacterium]|nr:hypothetical protein [bacterium]